MGYMYVRLCSLMVSYCMKHVQLYTDASTTDIFNN